MKTKILLHSVGTDNAIKFYRQDVPLETLEEIYPNDFDVSIDDFHPSTTPLTRFLAFHESDVIHAHATTAVQLYPDWDKIKVAIPMWNRFSGLVKVPPMLVIDLDDRYTEITAMNPSFSFWGIRRPDGDFLQKGDKITVDTIDMGEIVLWEDGQKIPAGRRGGATESTFDVEGNHRRLATLMNLVKNAGLVTVSTKRLKEAVAEDYDRTENVVVIPNAVRAKDFPMVPLPPSEQLTVLWQGGWSHHADLFTVRDAIKYLGQKYPQVKWKFFGQEFTWIMSALPENQREYIEWVEFSQHRLKLATIQHDIAICPLERTVFNQSKSAVKWYESTMRERPAMTVAANWGAYGDEIQDGHTGLLYDTPEEFIEKMSVAIENAELRQRLGDAAQRWIKAERNASSYASYLKEQMMDQLRRHRRNGRVFLERKNELNGALVSNFGSNVNRS